MDIAMIRTFATENVHLLRSIDEECNAISLLVLGDSKRLSEPLKIVNINDSSDEHALLKYDPNNEHHSSTSVKYICKDVIHNYMAGTIFTGSNVHLPLSEDHYYVDFTPLEDVTDDDEECDYDDIPPLVDDIDDDLPPLVDNEENSEYGIPPLEDDYHTTALDVFYLSTPHSHGRCHLCEDTKPLISQVSFRTSIRSLGDATNAPQWICALCSRLLIDFARSVENIVAEYTTDTTTDTIVINMWDISE